jgi:hypothetical protein
LATASISAEKPFMMVMMEGKATAEELLATYRLI